MSALTLRFDELSRESVPLVGGKNASLGEMVRNLRGQGIEVPDGFATTAPAYWRFVDTNGIREVIEREIGPLVPLDAPDPSQPATDFAFADGVGRMGFINPVTEPFCHRCNRLRLTAEGQVRNCLFSLAEWDARQVMRGGGSDDELAELVRASIGAKKAGHGINSDEFIKPDRAMYQIGG